jgi:hypothetical protein
MRSLFERDVDNYAIFDYFKTHDRTSPSNKLDRCSCRGGKS